MAEDIPERRSAPVAFMLLLSGTILGIAGTDLVLPAVPSLPALLGGTPALAQLVLAAFVTGTAIGLLAFGEIAAYVDRRKLLVASLLTYGLISFAAAYVTSLETLVALRVLQGAAGSAPAVLAPGMIRSIFDERHAVRALGLLGSIESLVPALAPLAGVWLLAAFGWQASFEVIGALALVVAVALLLMRGRLPAGIPLPHGHGGYGRLLRDAVFLRYALSQAFSLGGLLVFVFGAPAVITGPLGGTIADFITMQITGIAFFITGSNLAGWLATRLGAERVILWGTVLSAAGMLAILVYALAGGTDPLMLAIIFVPVNLGFGLRGPPGFMRAIVASGGDDARGAALVVLAILVTAAAGTALAAPFITSGLVVLAGVSAAVSSSAALCLVLMPRLDEDEAKVGQSS